ncbi:unnamed protein product [Ectocarpus sp. 12 AP-2014]
MASLKEILNLDKAELVFQRLVDAVESHSLDLAAVRRDVSRKASGEDLRGMCTEINGRLAALERRVAATEAAVTIPENSGGSGGSFTVGEAVRANGQALLGLSKQLEEKAGRDELSAKVWLSSWPSLLLPERELVISTTDVKDPW